MSALACVVRAHAAVRGDVPPPRRGRIGRRLVMGDPQAPLSSIAVALDHHGLIGPDGWLADDASLLVVGDFFDHHPHPPTAAADGLAFLAWCAAHPDDRVRILMGNHDHARVSAFHGATLDGHERNIGALDRHDLIEDPMDQRAFRVAHAAAHPGCPPLFASRDYRDWHPDQTMLVHRLVGDRRFRLASHEMVDGMDGRPVPAIATHAGVTIGQAAAFLRAALFPDAAHMASLAVAADAWFDARIAACAGGALDLAPLMAAWSATTMYGGLLVQRPVHPLGMRAHHVRHGFDLPVARDVLPWEFLPGVQIIGHTAHPWSRAWPDTWVTGDARASHPADPHRLVVGPARTVRHDIGWAVGDIPGATHHLLMVDGMLGGVDPLRCRMLPVRPH